MRNPEFLSPWIINKSYINYVEESVEFIKNNQSVIEKKDGGDVLVKVDGKNISLSSDKDISVAASEKFGGALRLSAAQSLNLGSDLYIRGSITCDTLTAESRVNAGMGVFAGPYGFTSALGGLSLGMPTSATPVATPGSINIVGSVTALGSVNAPTGNFIKTNVGIATNGIASSILSADLINDILYDVHFHLTKFGPTTMTPEQAIAAGA